MNRSCVVTGAGQGIGLAIFERLVKHGWHVVAIEHDESLVDALRSREDDGSARVLHGDVTKPGSFDRAVALATESAELRGWVNNAGIVRHASLHAAEAADVRLTWSVNAEAVYWGCAAAVRRFLSQGTAGAIVNISSIHARLSAPLHAAYEMSKAAVEALTRNIAVEYGPHGIRCNAVAPGAIRTPLLEAAIASSSHPMKAEDDLRRRAPLARIGDPSEIAAVVAFLLTEDAQYLTGQSIAVDGGWSASLIPPGEEE